MNLPPLGGSDSVRFCDDYFTDETWTQIRKGKLDIGSLGVDFGIITQYNIVYTCENIQIGEISYDLFVSYSLINSVNGEKGINKFAFYSSDNIKDEIGVTYWRNFEYDCT